MNSPIRITLSILFLAIFAGWGGTGHRHINSKITEAFPPSMNSFLYWSQILADHASDADDRKGSDPNESPKHYIDIDNYPEFVSGGSINQSYQYNVNLHGYNFVIDQGVLPWAILTTIDSIQAAFSRRDWNKAALHSADLGHYVGDGHMPLHITRNYNGQYTNQSGVHSRYESSMIGRYIAQFIYTNDTASYVTDKSDYVFNFLYGNYEYVDSVLYADSLAKSIANSTSSNLYYQKLWEFSSVYTIELFKKASKRLADLIYTAWVDAGRPDPNITYAGNEFVSPLSFYLFQNYPNPFNPSTMIKYQVPFRTELVIKIYDIIGNEIRTLDSGLKEPGIYELNFDAHNLPSGVYIYKLETPLYISAKKLLIMK